MDRNYWKHAGNAKWGMEQLAKDMKSHLYPKRTQKNQSNNTNIRAPTTNENTPEQTGYSPAPSYVTNYYNSPNQTTGKQFQTIGLFKTMVLIVFLSLIVLITYYLITEPEVLVEFGRRIVEFFK